MLSGSIAKSEDYLWLSNLKKPWFTPPNWVFMPTWVVLYIMMGIAISKIIQSKVSNNINNKNIKTKNPAPSESKGWLVYLFIFQLFLNLLWSPIFFHYRRIDLALYDIFLLWINLLVLTYLTHKIKLLLWLLLPYLSWVSFALLLNLSIYNLNL